MKYLLMFSVLILSGCVTREECNLLPPIKNATIVLHMATNEMVRIMESNFSTGADTCSMLSRYDSYKVHFDDGSIVLVKPEEITENFNN